MVTQAAWFEPIDTLEIFIGFVNSTLAGLLYSSSVRASLPKTPPACEPQE